MMRKQDKKLGTYIFDLDGTIANCEHRRHLVNTDSPNWAKFFQECIHDTPNEHVIRIMNLLWKEGYFIAILSGRSNIVEDQTIQWLSKNGVLYDYICMRKEGDYRPDTILKKGMLTTLNETIQPLQQSPIRGVFDDRDVVVQFWRDEGIPCFQVARGDF